MSGRSPGGGKGAGGSRCLLILRRCLAIQLQKVRPGDSAAPPQPPTTAASEFWMYDSGYLLFQGFLEANLKCFWNASLLEAMRLLEFQGYVAPGVLLVTASACALEVVRAAWSRNVLKPPSNYVISVVGDVEDCLIQPLPQGQFTPLPEALCWVILDLTSSGQAAVLERIRSALAVTFPDMTRPSTEVVYDTLAKLTQERKVYQTSQGYFVVTPEKRRRHSRSSRGAGGAGSGGVADSGSTETTGGRPMLMSTEEALALVHGEMQTIRDGDVTHQAIQTNLADVICGGNPNDKIIYPKVTKRSSSFPIPNRMERRHSLRLFGSSKRLANSLSRSGSMRHICNKHLQASDSSSSTEYPSTDCSNGHQLSGKKSSLLSRLFRRSGRKQRGSSAPPASLATFSAQFPPVEWFNQRVVHLHSVGTQTMSVANSYGAQANGVTRWTDEDATLASSRSATLPRRHRRHTSSGGDSISVTPSVVTNSTPRSSRRHRSPSSCSTLPRPSKTGGGSSNLSRSTSRTSVQPCSKTSEQVTPPGSTLAGTASPSPSIMSRNVSSSSSSPNKSLQRNRSRSPSLGKASSSGSTVIASKTAAPGSSKVTPSASGSSLPGTKGTNNSPARSAAKSTVPNGRVPPALTNGGIRNGSSTQVATNKSSITLQVSTTNHTVSPPPASSSGYSSVLSDVPSERSVTVTSESPSGGTGTTTTTTINGSNTKVYVQQQNSPVRSVITFENGLNKNKSNVANKDIVILNGFAPQKSDSVKTTDSANVEEGKTGEKTKKPERPKSLYGPGELKRGQEKKCPSLEALNVDGLGNDSLRPKLTNALNGSRIPLPVSVTSQPSRNTVTSHPNAHPPSTPPTSNDPMMNNTRIVSSIPGSTASKESLSFKNILHDDTSDDPKSFFCSNPPSPTKSFDSFGGGSFNNLYIERGLDTKGSNPKEFLTRMRSVEEGFNKSPPEISPASDLCPYPSLGDLTVHFKSIAAQKILKGVSINSIDTLVEVNMAAAEKQNNCDVTIHTDFGMV